MAESNLINIVKLRASIKRMFSNNIYEVLSELFQNSQRAGAKNVRISAAFTRLEYEDDGVGIKGKEGLRTLLTLGGSGYDQKVMEDQNPMGLGINALLTMEDVETVIIESGGVGINIDTKRWWDDETYWQGWEGLVYTPQDGLPPFKIKVQFKGVNAVNKLMQLTNRQMYQGVHMPGRGYEGILNITLNDQPIDTTVPSWYIDESNLIYSGQYQGNKVIIKGNDLGYIVVNWYGQLINTKLDGFFVYLEVKEGRPLEPKAPVREGLIQDSKLNTFINFIKDTVFGIAQERAKEGPLGELFSGLRDLDQERFSRHFIKTSKVEPYEGERYGGDPNREQIFLKAKPPRIIGKLIAHWQGKEVELEGGLNTFANSLDFDVYQERFNEVQGVDLHWYPEEYTGPEEGILNRVGIKLVKAGHFTLANKRYEIKEPVLGFQNTTAYFYWQEYEDVFLGVAPDEDGNYDVRGALSDTIWALAEPNYDEEGNLDNFESDLNDLLIELKGGVTRDPKLSDISDYLNKLEGLSYPDGVKVYSLKFDYEGNKPTQVNVEYEARGLMKSTSIKLVSSWEV